MARNLEIHLDLKKDQNLEIHLDLQKVRSLGYWKVHHSDPNLVKNLDLYLVTHSD